MQIADFNNPSERKKLIAAVTLGVVAILFLWWTFIGFGGSPTTSTPRNSTATGPSTIAGNQPVRPERTQPQAQTPGEINGDLLNQLQPVKCCPAPPGVPDASRNIFAYYEGPPVQSSTNGPTPPPATPTPTPPVLVAAVSPSNIYARTGDFTLEVTGDKFTSEMKIFLDGKEMPTKYKNAQQLSTIVPAAMIAGPGQRQVLVRTSDGRLYSNNSMLTVNPPPTPNYNYVGIIGTQHFTGDIALVQDKNNKELLNVQRGDVLSGRFRVTSISDKELVLTDTTLKIKHSLPMSNEGEKLTPGMRPNPKVDADDDEP
jgi:hypothetical protein